MWSEKIDLETWPGYSIAGTEIDILCRHKNKYLTVDLIGFPGPWLNFFELDTNKLMKRAGVDILPISYGLWVTDKDACIAKISANLDLPISKFWAKRKIQNQIFYCILCS